MVESETSTRDYRPYTLFTYHISHLNKSDKVRFYYALKGRDGKSGVLKTYCVEQLTKTVLLVPPEFSTSIKEFLSYWKCSVESHEVLVR